ncbi:Rv3654c family TadE-like protein [Rhodoluna limnophila]|uniref:Rv3654c family TadE-like protein n=1 Tax=Rhodoluna limnophila TaxID=232537 RepID=UPI001561DA1C|nr:Rv3654c family TadE-like protein [Rhodoluna limnophila]
MRTDRGSGTILALAAVVASTALFGGMQIFAHNVLNQHRLQAATEAMALAATDSLRGLTTGFPCVEANEIALKNMAIVDECRIVGLEVMISAHLDGLGIVLTAKARAGPSY